MARLTVIARDGIAQEHEATVGLSVMQNIRDAGHEELLALCGGSCACATCHVLVDPVWLDRLAPKSADEQALLESSDHCQNNSRLSCQITFIEGLDGLALRIAPEG